MQRILFSLTGLAAALCLSACGSDAPAVPDAAAVQRAESLRPTNAALAAQYERACMTCHAVPGSGAPLTGFTEHWKPRMKQGMDTLVHHAIDGYQGHARAWPVRRLHRAGHARAHRLYGKWQGHIA
jgi:cytochrome c5